jgi:protein-S-isoprenylcysteine O-methyltransferase Ste14
MRGDTILAITVFVLLAVLVTVKRVATGSVLDRPVGGPTVRLVNVFNLLFLLVVSPLAGVLLAAGRLAAIDPGYVALRDPRLLAGVRIVGLVTYVMGFAVMAWALLALRHSYRLGGLAPRLEDELVERGPYRLVRHPMYAAVLSISLGLACLTRSLTVFAVFAVYLVLIHLLIPIEEAGLRSAYGDRYEVYTRRTRRLVPFVY